MLNLTEDKPGNHHVVRSVERDRIIVDDQHLNHSVIVGARLLDTDWPVASLDDLTEQTIEPLLALEPEVVILGAGTRPRFPTPAIQQLFFQRGIGLESMTLIAAARTFNVLMSENRRALAGLILPASRGST